MLIKLAFRNIFRNWRRTLLTFSAIAFSLGIIILMDSFLSGIDKDSYARIINFETGHIKIFSKGYQKDKDKYPLDKTINQPANVIARISNDPEVIGITSRVNFRLMLSDGIDQLPAIGVALDPQKDSAVFKLSEAVESGQYLVGTEEGMLLGEGLAEKFNAQVGSYMTILTRTKHDTYQALDLRVKGILKTEDPAIDWMALVISLDLAQKSLDLSKGVTEIDIKLKNPDKINAFRDKLARELTGVEIATWQDLSEDVVAVSETKRKMSALLFSSVVLIAFIGISNTILLSACERVKEIGMMAAMGMKRRQIVTLFIMEGTMIGLLGSLAGGLFGMIVNYPAVKYGMNWGFLLKDIGLVGYRVTGASYGVWRPGMVITVMVFGVVISALTSIYPAWIASKMEPTEALRKE